MVEGCFASTVTSCFDILVASQTVADSFVLPGDPYHCPVPVVSSDTTDSKSIRSTQPPAGPLCVCVCVCMCVCARVSVEELHQQSSELGGWRERL